MSAPLITFYDLDGSVTVTLVDSSKEDTRPIALPARRSFTAEHQRAGRDYLAEVRAIADRRAVVSQPAPVVVRVSHAYWHLFGDVERIAQPLIAGQTVEFRCGPRWDQAAAEEAAVEISAILLKRQILHTHAVCLVDGIFFVQFIPLEISK